MLLPWQHNNKMPIIYTSLQLYTINPTISYLILTFLSNILKYEYKNCYKTSVNMPSLIWLIVYTIIVSKRPFRMFSNICLQVVVHMLFCCELFRDFYCNISRKTYWSDFGLLDFSNIILLDYILYGLWTINGLMDRALDLKPEVTQGCGFESRLRQ